MLLNLYITYKYRKYTINQDKQFEQTVEEICNPSYFSKVVSYGKSQVGNNLKSNNGRTFDENLMPQNIFKNDLTLDNIKAKSTKAVSKIMGKQNFEKVTGMVGSDIRDIKEAQEQNDKREIKNRLGTLKNKYDEFLVQCQKFYKESLQNIVEGQREVMNNDEFKFDDNTSVKDRKSSFENSLKSIVPKYMQDLKFEKNDTENPVNQEESKENDNTLYKKP